MEYVRGQYVRHPAKPDWGTGQIIEVGPGEKLKVLFPAVGPKTLSIATIKLDVVTLSEPPAPIEIVMKLTVSPDVAWHLISQIPHSTCTDAAPQRWRVSEDGVVADESVMWLFCWAKTGMGSPAAAEEARRVFDHILPITFDQFGALVPHDYARRHRY